MDANMMKITQKAMCICSILSTIASLSGVLPDIVSFDIEENGQATARRIGKKIQNFRAMLQDETCARALSDDLDQVVAFIQDVACGIITQEGFSQDLQADLLLDIEKLEMDAIEHFCKYLTLFNLRLVDLPDVHVLQEKFSEFVPSDCAESLCNVTAKLALWLGSKKIRIATLLLAVEYVLALVTWLEQRMHDVELSVEKKRMQLFLAAIFKEDELRVAEAFDAFMKVSHWQALQHFPHIADEKFAELVHKDVRKPMCRICEISECIVM
jgi:hypothetical protein